MKYLMLGREMKKKEACFVLWLWWLEGLNTLGATICLHSSMAENWEGNQEQQMDWCKQEYKKNIGIGFLLYNNQILMELTQTHTIYPVSWDTVNPLMRVEPCNLTEICTDLWTFPHPQHCCNGVKFPVHLPLGKQLYPNHGEQELVGRRLLLFDYKQTIPHIHFLSQFELLHWGSVGTMTRTF